MGLLRLECKPLLHQNRFITYFLLLCLCSTSMPTRLFSQDCCGCEIVNCEDVQRTKNATIVAGATVIGLVAGVAYFAFGSNRKCHHHSSSSSCCYSNDYSYCSSSHSRYTNLDPPFPSFSSSSHSHGHSGHHHHHHHHHYSSHFPSSFYSSSSSFDNLNTDPQIFERGDILGDHPARLDRRRKLARCKASKESGQLSGLLTSHPSSSSIQGSFTAFVQLPDGSTQVLGHLPLSGHGGAALSYGPFNQKGTYVFGISLDEGTHLATQLKVASIDVNVNGANVQSGEFFVPPHAPANYESTPFYYDFQ